MHLHQRVEINSTQTGIRLSRLSLRVERQVLHLPIKINSSPNFFERGPVLTSLGKKSVDEDIEEERIDRITANASDWMLQVTCHMSQLPKYNTILLSDL
jgi:hypothetical protein